MKKKFLLPMMAFVFAIGMSFATEKSTADATSDWALTPNGPVEIAEITNCGNQDQISCKAQLSPEGAFFPVYEDEGLSIPKMGGAEVERHLK